MSRKSKYAKLEIEEARLRYQGDYLGALKVLDQMIALDDTCTAAFNNKGAILMMFRRYKEALPVLERAVVLDPHNGQALNNCGFCYYATGLPEKAVPLYHAALQKGYTHEGVNYNLGCALFALGRADEGLEQWEFALRKNPLYTTLLNELYQLAQAVGAIHIGEPVDHTLVEKVKQALKQYKVTVILNRTSPGMMWIVERKT